LLLKITISILKNLQTDPDSVPGDSGCDSVLGILAEFEFWFEFHWNRNYNLAGTPAKIPFPQ